MMSHSKSSTQQDKKKGFWSQLIDRVDKKLQEKAKRCCCCQTENRRKGDEC